ncbi:MAG: PDZ domain-containing protein [Proteobacteria bacterium]|nr:PDZ domain-containing protein [Pseudomonadota bacterium]
MPSFVSRAQTDPDRFGIFIEAVQPHSPASEAGLSEGTIILEVNGVLVVDSSVDIFISALRSRSPARLFILEVQPGTLFRLHRLCWLTLQAPEYEPLMDDGVGLDAVALHDLSMNDSAV